jgi:cobalt-zinc-cadmium efflux system outer membrane protein
MTESDFLAAAESELSPLAAERYGFQSELFRFRERALWPNPEVSYDRQAAGGPSDIDDVTETTWTIEQRFPLFTFSSRLKQARAGRSLSEARMRESAARRRRDVRLAYAEAAALQSRAELLESAAEDFSALDRIIAERKEAGEASGYARIRIGLEAENLKALYDEAAVALWGARKKLLDESGASPEGAWRVEAPSGDFGRISIEGLRETARASRAALQASRARYDVARAEWREGRGMRFPEISFYAGKKEAEDSLAHGSGSVWGFNVSVPLFNRGQHFRASKRWEMQEAEVRMELAGAEVMREVETAYAAFERLSRRKEEYERGAASRAGALRNMAKLAFEAGEMSLVEYLDAQRAALEAVLRRVEIGLGAQKAWIGLEAAVGEPLPVE